MPEDTNSNAFEQYEKTRKGPRAGGSITLDKSGKPVQRPTSSPENKKGKAGDK